MDKKYKTKQRELVLDCIIAKKHDHVTADDIEAALEKNGTPVGKSTIYRHLAALLEAGTIKKHHFSDNIFSTYEYICGNYGDNCICHLKCSKCGQVLHLEDDITEILKNRVAELYKFDIDNTKTVLYGNCEKCRV